MTDQSSQPQGSPCSSTVERIGDTVVLVVPAGGHHYEITMSRTYAVRLGAAIVRVATNDDTDSLSDVQLDSILDTFDEGTTP